MNIAEKLTTIANNEQKIYDKGRSDEWSDFWDIYQTKGTRTNYNNAFAQAVWDKQNFKPKYDVKPTTATSMFNGANLGGVASIIEDLDEHLAQFGTKLDFSNCTTVQAAFASCTFIKKVETLDFTKCTASISTANVFSYCGIHTIGKMKFADDGSTYIHTTMFNSYTNLINITFEGLIAMSINMQSCKNLSVESMKSVIAHLVNYADTDNEGKYTVTFTDEKWADLEESTSPYEDGLTDNSALSWIDFVTEKGWLIA